MGNGPRRAHLIHCSLASSRAFIPLMAEFTDDLDMVAVDMPGHGRSAAPDLSRDLQIQTADASIALIEQSNGPVDLIGHSFGATVALRITVQRPDLLRSLILFEPVFFAVLDDAGHPGFAVELAADSALGEFFEAGDNLGAAAYFLSRWGLPGEWDNLADDRRQLMADRMEFLKLQPDSIYNSNDFRITLTDLTLVETPTLLLNGSDSPEVIEQVGETIVAAMPNARLECVDGAGHMLPITHVGEVSQRMRVFFQM